jgi:hypothetical protein
MDIPHRRRLPTRYTSPHQASLKEECRLAPTRRARCIDQLCRAAPHRVQVNREKLDGPLSREFYRERERRHRGACSNHEGSLSLTRGITETGASLHLGHLPQLSPLRAIQLPGVSLVPGQLPTHAPPQGSAKGCRTSTPSGPAPTTATMPPGSTPARCRQCNATALGSSNAPVSSCTVFDGMALEQWH